MAKEKEKLEVTLIHGRRFRIRPNKEDERLLIQYAHARVMAYNFALSVWQYIYEHKKVNKDSKIETYSHWKAMMTLFDSIKANRWPWLVGLNCHAARHGIKEAYEARQRFFEHCKKKREAQKQGRKYHKKFGYPRYRSTKNASKTCCFPDGGRLKNGVLTVGGMHLKVMSPKRIEDGLVSPVTITRDKDGKWYVSGSWHKFPAPLRLPPVKDLTRGYDFNLRDDTYLTRSDGKFWPFPQLCISKQPFLSRTDRRFSRKKKGSNRRKRAAQIRRRRHGRVAKTRELQLHHLANQIVQDAAKLGHGAGIVLPGDDLHAMGERTKKKKYGKRVQQAGLGRLRQMVVYKAKASNVPCIVTDQYFKSTQTCSSCGYENPSLKDVSIREWTCPSCFTFHHRDVNASINEVNQGYKQGLEEYLVWLHSYLNWLEKSPLLYLEDYQIVWLKRNEEKLRAYLDWLAGHTGRKLDRLKAKSQLPEYQVTWLKNNVGLFKAYLYGLDLLEDYELVWLKNNIGMLREYAGWLGEYIGQLETSNECDLLLAA